MKMKLEEKVKTFTTEKIVIGNVDPLPSWSSRLEEYPRPLKLGAKYLVVLASSTPTEQAMSTMNLILNKKRLKL